MNTSPKRPLHISRLSDELGGYIISQSVMKRGERDTAYYESFEQKTQSISLAYMEVFVEEEKEMGDKFYLKARIEMDDQQLDKELKDAGFSDKKELLQVVIALMEANNIGAYDFKLSEVANTVLSGFSNRKNGQWIFFNIDGTARKVEYDRSGRESSEEIISDLNEVNSLINRVKDDWSKHVD